MFVSLVVETAAYTIVVLQDYDISKINISKINKSIRNTWEMLVGLQVIAHTHYDGHSACKTMLYGK